MAWDKKDDVLGQIFDFIYAQQELPPSKRKPIDTTGVAGDKELIDAVSAILENPAIFNVNTIADEYSDAINIKLAELRFSEDNIKKAEVGTSNLADIIKDPVGYAKKIRDTNKAIRKSMRAKYLGASATEFVVSTYLRKQGFSKELRDIIKNDTRFRDSVKELYEFSDYKDAQAYAQGVAQPPRLSKSDREYLNSRTAKLIPKLSMSKAQWERLTDNQKNNLTKGVLKADKVDDIRDAFRDVLGRTRGDAVFRNYQRNVSNLGSYSNMEIVNLQRELSSLESSHRRDGQWDSDSARLVYERTKLTKEFLENSENMKFVAGRKSAELLSNTRRYMGNINTQINDIKSDLRDARRRGDTNAQRILKEQLKMTKATRSKILQVSIVGNIGMVEGYVNSLKDYWNLPAVIKGDFFKSTKNQFYCPTAKVKFKWNDKVLAEYMVPAHHDDGDGRNAILKSYEEFWGRAYYFTPGAMFRTFFYNGEGFAWRAHLQEQKIREYIRRNGNIANFNLNDFMNDSSYRKDILSGTAGITNQHLLDMLERYSRLGDVTQMFSVLYRTQEKVLKWADDKFFTGFREKVYEILMNSRILSRLSDGSVATGLLKQWASKGGLGNLFRGLSHGISEALGIAAGPGLNLLITTITNFTVERIYDLAVPIFGVIVYCIFGIIGVLVLSYGIIFDNSVRYNISASTPPGSVGYCEVADSGFMSDPTDEYYGTPVHVPPPTDSSCPLGDTAYLCTQGFTNTTCSHVNMKAKKPVDIDGAGGNIQYFYAPKYCDNSNCTASTVVNPGRCSDGNYTGQWVTFNDGNGNVFTLGHTKFIPPSNGSNYSAGEPVAYVYQSAAELIADDPEQRTSGSSFYCWTGSHIHLLITQNGTPIDPLAFLYDMGCVNGPSSEAECPACIGG
jgi:predicted transcriptional regulator